MKKIVAIGASNSRYSINKQLATWAAKQIDEAQVDVLDLNEFEMPIYSIDREKENGIPKLAQEFKAKINDADGLVISLAEYNGSYTSAFKNIVDWVSRIEGSIWGNKPTLLMATSPGARGGMSVLSAAKMAYPYQGAEVAGSFSLPSFSQNFKDPEGISDLVLLDSFRVELNKFTKTIGQLADGAAA